MSSVDGAIADAKPDDRAALVARLPSTSAANVSRSFERKLDALRAAFAEHGLT